MPKFATTYTMVKIRTQEMAEVTKQFESVRNGVKNCTDPQALYTICKSYTNFLERIARKYNTTVNGVQSDPEAL